MAKILAIDTSTDYCSVALWNDNAGFVQDQYAPRNPMQVIYPLLDRLFAEAGIALQQLDALAFGCGPGSFTGLRIAAGITQSLALVANTAVIAISNLRAVAQRMYQQRGYSAICVVENAYRQEVYWGMYRVGVANLMEAAQPDQLVTFNQVSLPTEDWVMLGNVAGVEALPDNLSLAPCIVQLAQQELAQGNLLSAAQAVPVYLRAADSWSTRS